MSKRIKDMLVSEIRSRMHGIRDILIVNSSKLDAVSDNRLRLSLRKKNIRTLTVRNKLAKKALEDEGITGIDPYLEGPSTLIWGGEDIVALSKEIAKWAKDLKPLEIKGGISEGTPLSAAAVDQLSTSPGRLELIGQIVGLALSPGAQLAAAILGPGGKIAGQIKSIADKSE
jgi:large subunit ribosomal protein L10